MAAIQIFKCATCKKNWPSVADAEACEQAHIDRKVFIEDIKKAADMEQLAKAYAAFIQTVAGVPVVQIQKIEFVKDYYAKCPTGIQMHMILTGEPKATSCREFSRFHIDFLEDQGLHLARVQVNKWQTQRALQAYFSDRERLCADREARMTDKNNMQNKIITESTNRLKQDPGYLKLMEKIDQIRLRIEKEVEEEFKTNLVDYDMLISVLDETWINMTVIL